MRSPQEAAVCGVCGAPKLVEAGVCVFCRSPLEAGGEPGPLLDYLAQHLPGVEVGRGVFGRGRIRQLRVAIGGQEFSAQAHRDVLELRPQLQPQAWVDELVRSLTEASRTDVATRTRFARSGWAWR
ncbi:MAG TPA: hypothetical protein VIA06_12045 [Candidatus Dormibacteraeota bacterium]|nr:hypothetical protein [Candidatus Dormibacteraeota bacterium]